MPAISEKERTRRRNLNESVIGTNLMEGLTLDGETLSLMRLYEEGEMDREQLSAAIDLHVDRMIEQRRSLSVQVGSLAGAA